MHYQRTFAQCFHMYPYVRTYTYSGYVVCTIFLLCNVYTCVAVLYQWKLYVIDNYLICNNSETKKEAM